jgi:hypothetical protein
MTILNNKRLSNQKAYKMKSKLIIIAILGIFVFSSCEKREEKSVKYIATNAISDYNISYRLPSGELKTETISASSMQDQWTYSFIAEQGDIVYVSGNYKDINSGLNIRILIDNKVYKQGSSIGDTVRFVTVSGVVPYE